MTRMGTDVRSTSVFICAICGFLAFRSAGYGLIRIQFEKYAVWLNIARRWRRLRPPRRSRREGRDAAGWGRAATTAAPADLIFLVLLASFAVNSLCGAAARPKARAATRIRL